MSNFQFTEDFMILILFLMKAKVTGKKIILCKLFFMNCVRASAGDSLQYLICLKSKCVYIFWVLKSVNFGFKYIYIFNSLGL